jgi:hypothetical protein
MKLAVLLIIGAGVLATLVVMLEARGRRRRLVASGRNGLFLLMANHSVRREGMRLVKHLLLYAAVLTMYVDSPVLGGHDPIFARNIVVAIVCALMGLSSLLERHYHCRLERRLEIEGTHPEDAGPERRIERPLYPMPPTP